MARSALAEQTAPATLILLVEDNSSDAFLISDLLDGYSDTPYETHHVKTQSEAMRALRERAFDVCLLDLTLPDAAGFSALIDIQDKAPDMPVLILTGVKDTSLAKRAVGRGAQDYLLKDEMEPAMLARAIDYARERKRIEKELFQRANYDTLTGLANRSLFEARLKMALARAQRARVGVAVLFIDLDRFKPINDRHGHEAGDFALKTVAQRIKAILRAYDTAARLGGDEFAVMVESIASPRDAAMVAQKIISTLAPAMSYYDKKLAVGASIGIAYADATQQLDTMLPNADAAMYQAKAEGGNAYRFYAADIQHTAKSRLRAEEDLRQALSGEQLKLHYQPYVGPQGSGMLGIEVLLRWAHPLRNLLCPGDFLGMAEDCRLMPEIGKWMFATLHRDIAQWNAQGMPPFEIAFNICGSQLDAPDLLSWMEPLTAKGVPGRHRLAAEIDSDALASSSETRLQALTRLRDMGVALHLDHFGQGPVSLQMLHTFPFSLLKLNIAAIERVSGKDQAEALVRTSIELAHQLGMKASVVGVETQWRMQMLKAAHCDILQGFLIGHPMTAEQLPGWLAKTPVS